MELTGAEEGEPDEEALEPAGLEAEVVELGALELSDPEDAASDAVELGSLEEGSVVGFVSISANAVGESQATSRRRNASPAKKEKDVINFLRAIMGGFFCSFLPFFEKDPRLLPMQNFLLF